MTDDSPVPPPAPRPRPRPGPAGPDDPPEAGAPVPPPAADPPAPPPPYDRPPAPTHGSPYAPAGGGAASPGLPAYPATGYGPTGPTPPGYGYPPPASGQTPGYGPPPGYRPPPGYGQQPGYGSPYGQQPYGYGYAGQGPSNGLGLTSMILGIVSVPGAFLFVGFVPAILAVIFGFIGRSRVKHGTATNAGQALAGLILGFVGIAIFVGFVVLLALTGSSGGGDTDSCFGNNCT